MWVRKRAAENTKSRESMQSRDIHRMRNAHFVRHTDARVYDKNLKERSNLCEVAGSTILELGDVVQQPKLFLDLRQCWVRKDASKNTKREKFARSWDPRFSETRNFVWNSNGF